MVSHSDSNQPTKSDLSQSSASASLRSSFSLSISRYSSSVRSQASVSALTCRSRSRRCCALRAGFRCLSISQRASPDPVFYTANDLPYSTVLDLVLLRGRTCSTPPRPSRGRPLTNCSSLAISRPSTGGCWSGWPPWPRSPHLCGGCWPGWPTWPRILHGMWGADSSCGSYVGKAAPVATSVFS